MLPVYLILFTVVFIHIFIRNIPKFSKAAKHNQVSKRAKAEIAACDHHKPGHLRMFVEIFKMLYCRYKEDIPNYEVAQRVMAKFGNIIVYKFPFGSMEYQVIGDPVYAKSIMADPSWTEVVPIGYYLQDAGFHKPYGLLVGGGKYWKSASRLTRKLLQQLGFYNPMTMEGRFAFEMEELQRKFNMELALNGGEYTFCPRDTFGYLSINVVFHILLGKRNPFDETVVTKLMSSVYKMNNTMAPFVTLLEIIPFLRHFPKLTFLRWFQEASDLIYGIMREIITEKRRAGNYKELPLPTTQARGISLHFLKSQKVATSYFYCHLI